MFRVLISYTDTIFPLIALIVFFILRNKIGKKEELIHYFLLFNFVLFGLSNILANFRINNLFLYHIYALVELWLIGYYIIVRLLQNKNAWLYICIGFTLFWVLDILTIEPLDAFPSFSGGLSNFILIIISMSYFFRLAKSDAIMYFQKLPTFWIVSAFLIACSFTILAYVMYNFYVTNKLIMLGNQIATILYISTIIKFTLIIIGLLCYKRPQIRSFSLLQER